MLKTLDKGFTGLVTVSGPTNSGKSELAEFLIKDHKIINYIATSKVRKGDKDWQKRINIHRKRRPRDWKIIEYPFDICKCIKSIHDYESILIDSSGGIVEKHLEMNSSEWSSFQSKFCNFLIKKKSAIIVVLEEIGWGIVPATPIGHLYRERLSQFSRLISNNSTNKWLVVQGTAIDLDQVGYRIP